ncbi:SUMF1/EgtB/PvdO family nonheme iron enzyme [bacterium]|nr:SUMF1/EgtB/PvdO family nonheme iron enzyme [bacterium]
MRLIAPVVLVLALGGAAAWWLPGTLAKTEPPPEPLQPSRPPSSPSPAPPPSSKNDRPTPPREQPLGWFSEKLPAGMHRGRYKPLYRWDTGKGLEIEMVYVPPGSFTMGSDKVESPVHEQPRHEHPMPRGYYLGRFETTWREYMLFCKASGHRAPARPSFWEKLPEPREQHPVTSVTWDDAKAFCDWAGLHLPTEPEWEKAARGPRGRVYPWGDDWDGSQCNHGTAPPQATDSTYDASDGFEFTAPVGSLRKDESFFGAIDMGGNVIEWTSDFYEKEAYSRYARGDLAPPASSEKGRVIRGGSYFHSEWQCRSSCRAFVPPTDSDWTIGFRTALSGE